MPRFVVLTFLLIGINAPEIQEAWDKTAWNSNSKTKAVGK